ncbi:hypothetical protein HDU91_006562 [Kappamyces sp. JEL0680]|nr:hypothetical protein HDU91_006562 [Kappamyces sp. JEL0680]
MSNAVKVSFIGGGNMANAIIGGLIAAGYSSSGMVVSDPYEPTRLGLEKNYGVKTTVDNNETITSEGTVLILAVKPQVMKTVAQGIAAAVQKYSPLVITIAAGITVSDLTKWLTTGSSAKAASIVRCMPNTPALVGEGATGVYATDNVTPAQRTTAFSVLQSISKSIYWVDKESLIDVVTGVSGSGPAYFFLMVEALEAAGVELGLPLEVARGLASQTCVGAGKMLVTSSDTPAELRRKVTSPNGTTEAAVKSFERDEIRQIIARAVKAAADRGGELGQILGAQVRAVLSCHRQ